VMVGLAASGRCHTAQRQHDGRIIPRHGVNVAQPSARPAMAISQGHQLSTGPGRRRLAV
jgi:hypothetical protein